MCAVLFVLAYKSVTYEYEPIVRTPLPRMFTPTPTPKPIGAKKVQNLAPTPKPILTTPTPTPIPMSIPTSVPTPTPQIIYIYQPTPTPQIIYVTPIPTPTPTPTPTPIPTPTPVIKTQVTLEGHIDSTPTYSTGSEHATAIFSLYCDNQVSCRIKLIEYELSGLSQEEYQLQYTPDKNNGLMGVVYVYESGINKTFQLRITKVEFVDVNIEAMNLPFTVGESTVYPPIL